MMLVGGLDLAKRSDHSALVLMEVGQVLTVTHALRLPHRIYRDQITALEPALHTIDRLAYDGTGVGDAVGEMLPDIHAMAVVITGNSPFPHLSDDGRIMVGKVGLIGGLQKAMADGRLKVAPNAPGRAELQAEMAGFISIPGTRKMEAKQGHHDDLVAALGLAVLAASKAERSSMPKAQ